MENRFITVIDRHGEKRRVKREEHLTRLRLEREFGDLTRFEGPTNNYSNESEISNSEPNNNEGSFNNTISNRENSNIVSPTPSNSPNKPKTKNKGKGSRKSKKNKSRRKGNRKSKKNKSRKEANKKRNAEIRSQRNAKATRNKKFNSPN